MQNTSQILVVGQIGAAYGIRGWVHVRSFTDPPANLIGYNPWYVSNDADSNISWQEAGLIQARQHNKGIVAQLQLATDRTQAETLSGMDIGVERGLLPNLDAGDFYWIDLIGTEVVDTEGEKLGDVTELIDNGAHTVLEVHNGGDVHLIPFVRNYVKTIEPRQRIVVDWDIGWD